VSSEKLILVAGATGNQGGAVLRRLISRGWTVRAMSRDPDKPATRALAEKGVEVVRGDFGDLASLEAALDRAYGVYGVQNQMQGGTKKETRDGIALAEAARAAGVAHFVYSSVGGAERNTGISHFESKRRIEERIAGIGLPATVLRPVFFTDNLAGSGAMNAVFWGAVAGALGRKKSLQVISVDDIGAFADIAFDDPERWIGRSTEIAGDEVTLPQAVAAYRAAKGRRPKYVPLPPWLLGRMDRDLGAMFRWFATNGYRADIPTLREIHPGLKSFEEGLRTAPPVRTTRR